MKIRSVVALVGLAISFALPTYAQQTNRPDPKLRERFISRFKALTDALDKSDAAATVACFTGRVFGDRLRMGLGSAGYRAMVCKTV
jgi:hypothetical protein